MAQAVVKAENQNFSVAIMDKLDNISEALPKDFNKALTYVSQRG